MLLSWRDVLSFVVYERICTLPVCAIANAYQTVTSALNISREVLLTSFIYLIIIFSSLVLIVA